MPVNAQKQRGGGQWADEGAAAGDAGLKAENAVESAMETVFTQTSRTEDSAKLELLKRSIKIRAIKLHVRNFKDRTCCIFIGHKHIDRSGS